MSTLLDLYEPLDVIGNGSFGIIRKVKRKSDGLVRPKPTSLFVTGLTAHTDFRQEGTIFRPHVGP